MHIDYARCLNKTDTGLVDSPVPVWVFVGLVTS